MAEMISLKDFIRKNIKTDELLKLDELLRSDGREMSGAIFDFLAAAFVDIADGALCEEMHRQYDNTEIWITIKRRAKNEK